MHFGRHCVLPVMLGLARDYPGLELDLSFSDRLLDLAEDGVDLAIRTGTLALAAGLVARRVASQPMIVCAAPVYLARPGRLATLDALAALGAHQALAYRRTGPVPPWLFPRDGQSPREVRPPNRIRLDDLDAIADAAVAGAGIAWLPGWLVRERVHRGELVDLLPDHPAFMYDVHALWLQAPHVARRIRVAVDALAAALPGMMT